MNPLPLSKIAQFAGGRLFSGDANLSVNKVSTDSRTLKRGELFVALRGENFDGHKFVEAVAKAGAAGAIVDTNWSGKVPEKFALISVQDTLQAYQNLAANYRRSLSTQSPRHHRKQRKDEHEGFRRFGPRHEDFESQKPKVISKSCRASPHNVGSDVRGRNWRLGNRDESSGRNRALAKIAAPDWRSSQTSAWPILSSWVHAKRSPRKRAHWPKRVDPQGTVILNADDPFSKAIAAAHPRKSCVGRNNRGSYRRDRNPPECQGSEFTIVEGAHLCRTQLPVAGSHMVQNAMLAVAAGRAFGLSIEESAAVLPRLR